MDPNQMNHMASAMAGMLGMILFIGLIITAIIIIPVWRILDKIGVAGVFSLLLILPWLGPLILLYVIAFTDWRITSLSPQLYPGLQPYPPPPPNYPPPSAPPTSYTPPPPTQL